jgi:hypothetical protein
LPSSVFGNHVTSLCYPRKRLKSHLFKGFRTYRVKTLWTGANQLGARNKFELLVSNYPVKSSDLYVEKIFVDKTGGL